MSLSRVSFVVVEVLKSWGLVHVSEALKTTCTKKKRYKNLNASMTDDLTYEMHFSKYDF